MNLWFCADWHLGEDRFEVLQRPFASVDEHVDFLVEKHNSLVKKDDDVIVVGDAVYKNRPEYLSHVSRFHGRKTLLVGNHDRGIAPALLLGYFDRVIREGDGLELDVCGVPCWATHYPHLGVADRFNLVGHVHAAWKCQLNMYNVGVDVNHFRPVSAAQVAFMFETIRTYYDGDTWIAYHPLNSRLHGVRGKNDYYFSK